LTATPIAEVGFFRKAIVSLIRKISPKPKAHAVITTPPAATMPMNRSPATAVNRNRIPPTAVALWVERGWKKSGNTLKGAYRTRLGGFRGEILLAGGDDGSGPSFYVFNPPPAILASPHRACYRNRGGRKYWVHFSHLRTIDSGIVEIETQLSRYERNP
jgi:hypothetical protein